MVVVVSFDRRARQEGYDSTFLPLGYGSFRHGRTGDAVCFLEQARRNRNQLLNQIRANTKL